LSYGQKRVSLLANGQVYYINLTTPTVQATSPVEVGVYEDGKPAEAVITFSNGTTSLGYEVYGRETVMLPPTWLNTKLLLKVDSNWSKCVTNIPALLTQGFMNNMTSPVIVLLKRGSYECYSIKVVLYKNKMLKSFGEATVIIDGKYAVPVRGSVVIVYYKPTATLQVGKEKVSVVLSGNAVEFVVPPKPAHVPKGNATQSVNVVQAVRKVGKLNFLAQLPSLLSMGVGMALALGVLNSGVAITSPVSALAYVLAATTMLVIVATLIIILITFIPT
jgi:hypothetical protein